MKYNIKRIRGDNKSAVKEPKTVVTNTMRLSGNMKNGTGYERSLREH